MNICSSVCLSLILFCILWSSCICGLECLTFILINSQEEKGATEDEMTGWHWLNGYEFEQTPGHSEGQGSLACCSPRGRKESDMTALLKTNSHYSHFFSFFILSFFPPGIQDSVPLFWWFCYFLSSLLAFLSFILPSCLPSLPHSFFLLAVFCIPLYLWFQFWEVSVCLSWNWLIPEQFQVYWWAKRHSSFLARCLLFLEVPLVLSVFVSLLTLPICPCILFTFSLERLTY